MGEIWVLFGMSVFGLLLPHLAAGEFEDARPLRMMALAVFVVTGTMLADIYLFDEYLWRSLVGSLDTGK
jgi:hypothetical protein